MSCTRGNAAIEAEKALTDEAKALRLKLYHVAVSDGLWNPAKQLYGLAVQQRHVWNYDDRAAIQWLCAPGGSG